MKVYILGSGQMALSMALGFRDSGFEVLIIGRNEQSLKKALELGFETEFYGENYDITGKSIILAFSPNALAEVSQKLSGKAAVCISVLARASLNKLKSHIRALKYAVCLPNLAAKFRVSVTPYMGDEASEKYLNAIGSSMRFENEKEFRAACVLSACSPAYLAIVADSLANGAVLQGVNHDSAQKLVVDSFSSMARLLKNTHPSILRDAVCTPAGMSIEGVLELEKNGVRAAFMKAVVASAEKMKIENE